jgi:hypothetical protein
VLADGIVYGNDRDGVVKSAFKSFESWQLVFGQKLNGQVHLWNRIPIDALQQYSSVGFVYVVMKCIASLDNVFRNNLKGITNKI